MKTLPKILITFLGLAMMGCSQDEIPGEAEDETPVESSAVQEYVQQMATRLNGTSSPKTPLKFKSTEVKKVSLAKNNKIKSVDSPDAEIYTVSFDYNGSDGFAMVGSYQDDLELLYLSCEGSVEQAMEVEPLAAILNEMPTLYATSIGRDTTGITDPTPHERYYMYRPLVTTTWGQGSPYNNQCPLCSEVDASYAGDTTTRCPAGCGAIAVAQFVATIGQYIATTGAIYDLHYIGAFATPLTSQLDSVAYIVRDLGVRLNSTYDYDGTSTYTSDITRTLSALGYNPTFSYGFDLDSLACELSIGHPHIAFGYTSNYEEGHFWIVDGIDGSVSNCYYHCNWGWNGFGNGWINGNYYTSPIYTFDHTNINWYTH